MGSAVGALSIRVSAARTSSSEPLNFSDEGEPIDLGDEGGDAAGWLGNGVADKAEVRSDWHRRF